VPDYDPYLFERRFGADTADWYRVDPATGERTLLVATAKFGTEVHKDLDRILVYHQDGWHSIGLESLDVVELADGRSFTRSITDHDYPGPRPSWGVGGWSEDGAAAYVNDRHDVWRLDLQSGDAVRLTDGRTSDEQFRVVSLDPDQPRFEPVLIPDEDLVLSVRHLRTKSSGYIGIDARGQEKWAMRQDARVGALTRAEEADRFAFRTERWDDSPDVFVASAELDNAVQITNTNPFQANFSWGHSELIDYRTDAGHDLQAVLVYPADFKEGRTYPLILYQYERLSDNLHTYNPPSERQYYNYQAWSQAGYFVLMPDILYEPGRPGPSALDAVGNALDAALETGHVDPDAMGLIGHSWGGYQASYLPTRTNRFAASVAGAAITNFMSFMGAVHWNGGLPETGHWETGQARMAAPYWDDLEGHLESSPANFITDLQTPILLMHGDEDGVVDFYQGLEFYNYARRAGKEVVLLVYPEADHGLTEEAQQVDYHRRILEWFGHYLKGEAPARWITEGESWAQRGRRMGG
jgi:dipeptidyl aminopeptidase/acylaminoacyl peptidase